MTALVETGAWSRCRRKLNPKPATLLETGAQHVGGQLRAAGRAAPPWLFSSYIHINM